MQRIVIIGCSGGGKSTLARKLGEKLNLPVTHLDVLFWKPNWVESTYEEFRPKIAAVCAGERWLIDGDYSKTFDLRLPRADTIIWIDQSRLKCLWRAFWRSTSQLGRNRIDLAEGCPEKYDWEFYKFIWNYRRTNIPKIERGLAEFGGNAKFHHLKSDKEIVAFLASL
ncbi:MAG: topology modulation protein [Parvibaculaceae bacterium]